MPSDIERRLTVVRARILDDLGSFLHAHRPIEAEASTDEAKLELAVILEVSTLLHELAGEVRSRGQDVLAWVWALDESHAGSLELAKQVLALRGNLLSTSGEAALVQRDLVRGHLVRLTDTQGGVHWVNAFLVRRIWAPKTADASVVLVVGSDEVIVVRESPDQVAGRLMQARIYTSDPAGVIGGGLGLLAASLFNRGPGPAAVAKAGGPPDPKAAAQPSAKRDARRRGPHGAR